VPIKKLEKQYKELFNNLHNIVPEEQIKQEKIFEENKKKNKKPKYGYKLEPDQLNDLIHDLPNGKACGLSQLSYEHIKNCYSFTFLIYLCKMYEVMIRFPIIPENFNISELKPLLKDPKGSNESIDSLRPVAVSEVLASGLRLILNNLKFFSLVI